VPRRLWPPIAALAFGVLLVFGVQAAFVIPDDFSASPELVAHYADDGHAVVIALGSIAIVVAALLMLAVHRWLITQLSDRGASGLALEVARGAATVSAALMAAGGATLSVTVWNGIFYDDLGAEATKLLLMLGWMLLSFAAMVAASAMVAATSLGIRKLPGSPVWLERGGYAVAAAVLLSPMVAPMLVLPIWLVASGWSLRGRTSTTP
jgi:hypothetical protein